METKKKFVVLMLAVLMLLPTISQAGNTIIGVTNQLLNQRGYTLVRNDQVNQTLYYEQYGSAVLLQYDRNRITSGSVLVVNDANVRMTCDAMIIIYAALQGQQGKFYKNDRVLYQKMARLFDAVTTSFKMQGTARFTFDDLVVEGKQRPDGMFYIVFRPQWG